VFFAVAEKRQAWLLGHRSWNLPQRRLRWHVGIHPSSPTVLVTTLVLAGAAAVVAGVPVPGDGPFQVTLFHTNDIHGSFLPEPATWRPDKAEVGGFVALSRHLAAERRTAAPRPSWWMAATS